MTQEEKFKEKTGKEFNDFYKKYRPKLIWFLMKLCNDEIEAEEVTDEAFVKSLDELDKYDNDKANYSTWLFIIAKRIMFHRIKEKKRFESIEQDHDGATIGDFLIATDNYEKIQQDELNIKKADIIKQKILTLPEKYAKVLTMREIDGLAYQEIAFYLDINLSTIKSQIRQGRIMLMNAVKKDFYKLDNQGIWS